MGKNPTMGMKHYILGFYKFPIMRFVWSFHLWDFNMGITSFPCLFTMMESEFFPVLVSNCVTLTYLQDKQSWLIYGGNYLEVTTASCCLYSRSALVFLFTTHHTCTVFIWIEAWAFISYKQFITRHYLSPFCILHRCVFTLEHWTSAFIWAQAYEPCFYMVLKGCEL